MRLVLALAACASPDRVPPLEFVRGGVVAAVAEPPEPGQRTGGGRVFVPHAWIPGERIDVGSAVGIAPERAGCVPIGQADLGDVERLIARGGEPPDTSLAFSPDSLRLAVGAYTGDVLVLDAWTGAVLAERHLAETMVKRVAWSADGATLYAGEQSPDAYVHALDATDLTSLWSVRLSDEVGSSAPPAGEDLYGVYTLPAAFGIEVLPGGDLLVAAAHGWNEPDGRRNRSRLLRLRSDDGSRVAAWPAEGAADATLWTPRVDGALVAVAVGRSADGPDPVDLPVGGVRVLELDGLEPQASATVPPLAPYFDRSFVWEAMDLDARRALLYLGLGDGRVVLQPLDGSGGLVLEVGTPVLAGDVPIAASVGFGALVGDRAVTVTSGTNIPYGAASPALRPPAAHPSENALLCHRLDGTLEWTWRGPHALAGLAVSPDADELVVGAGARRTDDRRDVFGALVFDLRDGKGSGDERLRAFCATEGPAFFRPVVSADGRLAVVEYPFLDEVGDIAGAYRVTVFR